MVNYLTIRKTVYQLKAETPSSRNRNINILQNYKKLLRKQPFLKSKEYAYMAA